MQNIKEYLYILVLKTYLIDKKTDIILGDRFLMNIDVEEEREWVDGRIISYINFVVSINNGQDINKITYNVNSWRSLSEILITFDTSKFKFILKRKILTLDNHYRIKTTGKIKNKEINKAILKEFSKQLQDLKNQEKIKTKKK